MTLVTGLALAAAAAALAGCTPTIGDACAIATDCSIQGTRVCDTSQPGGYCTIVGCLANTCPDNAACVEFGASLPGCPYDDYTAPSRLGTSMCMKTCGSDSDCRTSAGYVCSDPTQPPWSAVILDTRQPVRVCIIPATVTEGDASVDAQVCTASSVPMTPIDAPITFEGSTGGGEAGEPADAADAGAASDAGAGEAGQEGDAPLFDATLPPALDASLDAVSDTAATDAADGD